MTLSQWSIVNDVGYMFEGSGLASIGDLDLPLIENFGYMFANTTSLSQVGIINSENGINFEYMFSDSGLNILCGISTCKGIFEQTALECFEPPIACSDEVGYDCATGTWDCDGDLVCPSAATLYDCDTPMTCGLMYDCATERWVFSGSTMFENTVPTSPTQDEVDKIIQRWTFRSSQC